MQNLSQYLTRLNIFAAVVLAVLIFDLSLVTRLGLAWHQSHADQSDQYQADLAHYTQLQGQVGKLRNLPTAVSASRSKADKFIDARMSPSFSASFAELGRLASDDHVKLTRAQYSPSPAVTGLAEVRIDASLTGEYTPLMHFINDLERDKAHSFYILRSIALTGQQGGQVALRMRITTYMQSSEAQSQIFAASAKSASEVE